MISTAHEDRTLTNPDALSFVLTKDAQVKLLVADVGDEEEKEEGETKVPAWLEEGFESSDTVMKLKGLCNEHNLRLWNAKENSTAGDRITLGGAESDQFNYVVLLRMVNPKFLKDFHFSGKDVKNVGSIGLGVRPYHNKRMLKFGGDPIPDELSDCYVLSTDSMDSSNKDRDYIGECCISLYIVRRYCVF